ncbi:unnamed protein product [Aphanomyces euteiches]
MNNQPKRLEQLVHDLKTKKCLCCARDYPGITLDELNQYVEEHGPLVNPLFGEQPAFFIDEDHFTLYRMTVYGCAIVAAKIAELVGDWAKWSTHSGRVITGQGAFILEQTTGTRKVRMPDVAYAPRACQRNVLAQHVWACGSGPFAPTFVVEIDKLAGEGSRRQALDVKMRNDYFQHGVQLAWLIDPRPQHRIMYVYSIDAEGRVHCDGHSTWRDLDGGDVLPGFYLHKTDLDMVLNQDSGSSSEGEVDVECPYPGYGRQFTSLGPFCAHVEWHRAERARQKFLAKQS